MDDRHHMIACFDNGEWTDTAPADMIAEVIGMTERQVLRYAATTEPIPRTGIRLVDLNDFPRSTCHGCFLECHRPWPCSDALSRFAVSGGRDG